MQCNYCARDKWGCTDQ